MTSSPRVVLVATDLSEVGDGAVAVAFRLAGEGSTVHLLHVCEPVTVLHHSGVAYHPTDANTEEGRGVIEGAQIRARRHLTALVPGNICVRGVGSESHVVSGSPAAATIAAESRRLGADVVVLATHGRTGIGRLLMGSVAAEVLRTVKVPVVLVHPGRTPR